MDHFERKFWIDGDVVRNPLWFVRYRNDVATTLPLEVFTQRHFEADFSRQKSTLLAKHQNHILCHPLGDLGVTYMVHLWLVGKRVVNFLLMPIENLSLAVMVEALQANIGRNRCV